MSPADSNADDPHNEVLQRLRSAAPVDPAAGERVRLDRGSLMAHLGLRTPVRRRLVKEGFSFTTGAESEILAAWDEVWQRASCADVMFAVLDYYRDRLPTAVPSGFWTTASHWIARVDNWAHADDLARLYSFALAADRDTVYPQLAAWNAAPGEWERRISIVSLVHYSGKNSFFMPTDLVFALLEPCLDDERASVQKAVGWVLREASDSAPSSTQQFLTDHVADLQPATLRRATAHLQVSEQQRLRDMAGTARRRR